MLEGQSHVTFEEAWPNIKTLPAEAEHILILFILDSVQFNFVPSLKIN